MRRGRAQQLCRVRFPLVRTSHGCHAGRHGLRAALSGGRYSRCPVRRRVLHRRPLAPASTAGRPARRAPPADATSSSSRPAPPPTSAGYRACKRCLPDAVPGSPEWNLRSDVGGRAMRLIADGVVEREGVAGSARRLGYTTRHLNRLLTRRAGRRPARPRPRASRADRARSSWSDTDLPISEIAFAVRLRQHPAVQRHHRRGLRPDAVRSSARLAAASGARAGAQPRRTSGSPVGIELALPVREPFDAAGVFAWLAARAVPGVEVAGADRYARTLLLPGGPATFDVRADGRTAAARRRGSRSLARPAAARRPGAPAVRPRRRPGGHRRGAWPRAGARPTRAARRPASGCPARSTPHEMLIRALVGQQISVAAARTQLARLADAVATPLAAPTGRTG